MDLEYLVNLSTIEGTYFLTGEYRESEISVTKTPFDFKIPFSIELTSDVNIDTIALAIDDFNYKLNNNELSLDINLNLEYDFLEEIGEENDGSERSTIETEELFNLINNDESEEESLHEPNPEVMISEEKSSFTKYQVHIIKENESLEDILKHYQVSEADLASINDNINELIPGEKLIIEKHD